MLLSFLLFPRMIGPLWAMPSDASNAISGISDTINPGQISQLALSKETAFRARFIDQPPAHNQLYWRGPVFWNTDGRQWTLSPAKTIKQQAISGPASTTFQYSIVMEPHQQVWLYALDSPIKAPADVKITEDRQLISNKKLSRARAFDFTSSILPTSETINEEDKTRALALPDNTDIRIFQLASSWRDDAQSDMGVINNGLAFFNKENFYYTLTPPQLGNDPVADFLFDSKRGFCGHYATSFAVVLRAAGIPSRLVAGYQGGVYNGVGNFWEVRQADAHVWVEAWVQSLGWVRIDPTAAISPNRIQHAIDLNEQRIGDEIKFFIKPPDGLAKWGQQLNSILQTVDYYWESGVLAYGPEVQNDFLANFGLHGLEDMVLWLAILSGVFFLIFSVYLYRLKPNKIDLGQKAYLSFCKKLARRYDEKRPSDTSLDYFNRISESQPSLRERLLQVREHYLHCRYGGGRIEPLLASIKSFKL
jgi:transglutaminase-like putative cysteine protease